MYLHRCWQTIHQHGILTSSAITHVLTCPACQPPCPLPPASCPHPCLHPSLVHVTSPPPAPVHPVNTLHVAAAAAAAPLISAIAASRYPLPPRPAPGPAVSCEASLLEVLHPLFFSFLPLLSSSPCPLISCSRLASCVLSPTPGPPCPLLCTWRTPGTADPHLSSDGGDITGPGTAGSSCRSGGRLDGPPLHASPLPHPACVSSISPDALPSLPGG